MTQFKLGPSSLTEALYEAVRKRIIDGDIAPGEKVTEQRLAGEYNVARPTAKACVERLTSLGLLRRSAHKTAVVPVLTADEIEDLFFSRRTFERAAVAELAGGQNLPEETVRSQTAMTAAVGRHDFAEQVQADIAFHWSLVRGLNSPRLSRMYEMISGEIHLTMGKYAAHRSAEPTAIEAEHAAIIAAIEQGDVPAATQALEDHLSRAKSRILAQLEE